MILQGYKTYIVSGLVIVTAICYGAGVIDKEHFETIVGVLMGLGMAALHDGMTNERLQR